RCAPVRDQSARWPRAACGPATGGAAAAAETTVGAPAHGLGETILLTGAVMPRSETTLLRRVRRALDSHTGPGNLGSALH
ncbi:MAG TPA: hypothetical protein VF933_27900, partial [Streptosporangiaceae bacterium]